MPMTSSLQFEECRYLKYVKMLVTNTKLKQLPPNRFTKIKSQIPAKSHIASYFFSSPQSPLYSSPAFGFSVCKIFLHILEDGKDEEIKVRIEALVKSHT